jgi:hypothetical protein
MEDRLDPKDLLSSHFSVTCRTVGISAELTYNPCRNFDPIGTNRSAVVSV